MSEQQTKHYPKCWVFDINRRVYEKDANGKCTGGPIWREHWQEVKIVGETKKSWITLYNKKIPKNGGQGIAFSQEEISKFEVVEKRWRIADAVRDCRNYEKLKQIADILGVSYPS
jgi:hypothetical protein